MTGYSILTYLAKILTFIKVSTYPLLGRSIHIDGKVGNSIETRVLLLSAFRLLTNRPSSCTPAPSPSPSPLPFRSLPRFGWITLSSRPHSWPPGWAPSFAGAAFWSSRSASASAASPSACFRVPGSECCASTLSISSFAGKGVHPRVGFGVWLLLLLLLAFLSYQLLKALAVLCDLVALCVVPRHHQHLQVHVSYSTYLGFGIIVGIAPIASFCPTWNFPPSLSWS